MGEPLFREGQHRRILIDCNQRATRLNVFPKQRGMSAGAGRGVHDDVPWPRIEPAYYFSRQYGNVRQDNPFRKKPADLLMTTKKSVGARRVSLLSRYGNRTASGVRMEFMGLSANLDGLGDLGKVQINDFYSSHGPSTAPSRCQRTLFVDQG